MKKRIAVAFATLGVLGALAPAALADPSPEFRSSWVSGA